MLQRGSYEALKASVHATALGLFAVMGLYNGAAWFARREQHLAVNAVLYILLIAWEQRHVAQHLAVLRCDGTLPLNGSAPLIRERVAA